MNRCRHPQSIRPGRHQGGAVLYIALIMLLLLAMIGLIGMQIATLQERMAANYLASNMAFQRAEGLARAEESSLAAGGAFQYEDCAVPFDGDQWADDTGDGVVEQVRVRNIGQCNGQCSVAVGSDSAESLCNWFRITTFSRDRDTAAASSSLSAVDTIFIKP